MSDNDVDEVIENTSVPILWENPKPMVIAVKSGVKRIRQVAFLKAFAESGIVSQACKLVGINTETERTWRRSPDPWYAQQFKDALQCYRDKIEAEVHHRAIEGEEVAIIGKVQTPLGPEDAIIGTKRVKSDLLLMFHAKRHIPEFRDKYEAPKEEKSNEAMSPMAKITIRLDMIGGRQQTALPNIIDVTPEQE